MKDQELSIELKDDNQSSKALVYKSVFYIWTKNINIQYHYNCDKVAAKKIELFYISTNKMIADNLTKPLTYVKFHGFI